MKEVTDQTIDEIFSGFELSEDADSSVYPERKCVSFWVPPEYKEKYDMIQKRSRRKFGRRLREIVMRSIDRVEVG